MCLNFCCDRQSTCNRQGSDSCRRNLVNPLYYNNYIIGNQGPRGPQGLPGTSDAVYAVGTGTIAQGQDAPLTLSVATPTATPTVTNNAVNLPIGYYLVNYSISGSVQDGSTATVALQLNDSTISQVTSTGSTLDTSRTLLVQASAPSTLTIVNESTESLQNANAAITVLKVA